MVPNGNISFLYLIRQIPKPQFPTLIFVMIFCGAKYIAKISSKIFQQVTLFPQLKKLNPNKTVEKIMNKVMNVGFRNNKTKNIQKVQMKWQIAMKDDV